MPTISSILVGVAQGCSTSGYAPSLKKLTSMDSSDLLRIQKLRVLARSTTITGVSAAKGYTGGYGDLFTILYSNRVSVPLCRFQN